MSSASAGTDPRHSQSVHSREAVIREVLEGCGRCDTPYSYGAAPDSETGRQLVFFDLPRLSVLQFNVSTEEVSDRAGLVAKIRRAITERADTN